MRKKKDAQITVRTDKETKRMIQIKAKSVSLSMNKYMMCWALKGLREELNRLY
ncbi:hypothetical protein ACFLTJ_02640 [Chloroflexota bacterium]